MAPQIDDPSDSSIADLVHKLVDDGRTYVRAEANLYKQIAFARASKARNGLIALLAGAVLLLAALIVLLVMLAEGLAVHIGPVGGGLVVAGVTIAIALVLLRYGGARMTALSGDAEERTELASGERKA